MAFIWDLVLQIERILNIGSLMWPLNDLQAPILAPWYYPIKNGFIIFASLDHQHPSTSPMCQVLMDIWKLWNPREDMMKGWWCGSWDDVDKIGQLIIIKKTIFYRQTFWLSSSLEAIQAFNHSKLSLCLSAQLQNLVHVHWLHTCTFNVS